MQIEGVECIMTTVGVHNFFTEILLGVISKRADKRAATQDTLNVIHIPTDTEKKAWSVFFFWTRLTKTGNFQEYI